MNGLRVTINDVRSMGYCVRGARRFCLDHSGDWADFLQNGIEVSTLEGIDDAMVAKVVEIARARAAAEEGAEEGAENG